MGELTKRFRIWFKLVLQGLITALLVLTVTDHSFARRPTEWRPPLKKTLTRPLPEFKAHNVGNLWQVITNYGSFGDPNYSSTGRPSLEWPAGESSSYLYDGAVWVSTILSGEKWNTAYFYYFDEWEPAEGSEFLIGNEEVSSVAAPKSIQDSWVAFDDLEQEAEHEPLGIRIVRRGLAWSMPEVDDFIAYEFYIINTGLNGDLNDVYISYWYDLDVASIDASESHIDDLVDYDGWDGTDTNTDEVDLVDPLDLDGDGGTGYDEYGIPFGLQMGGANENYDEERIEGDGIFDEYSLIEDERGVPIMADVDVVIGEVEIAAGDTLRRADGEPFSGWKFPRGMSYIYDGDNPTSSDNDMGERDLVPTATGFSGGRTIYADPTAGDYYFDDPDSIHQRIVRPFSHQWWNWESDPDNDAEVYDYITGQHEFSQGYMFLPNPFEVGAPTFDYRFLHSVGPYDIPAGDTVKIVWAEGVGEGIGGLRQNLDNAIIAYYAGSVWSSPYNPSDPEADTHWLLPTPPAVPNLRYSPGDQQVKLVWDNIAEITPDSKTGEIDFVGYKIYRALYSPSSWTLVDVMFDKSKFSGNVLYVTNTDGDTLGEIAKADAFGISNSFIDVGGSNSWGEELAAPINGLPYYYTLVAFDTGDPATKLPPAESGKTNYKKSPAGAPIEVIPRKIYEGDPQYSMSDIKVVPNPYKGTGQFEAVYESKLKFTGLPPVAKISVFSLTGDLIISIEHTNGSSEEIWDLISRNSQAVVSGLYIYVVETDVPYEKFIGKFVVVR